MAFDRKRIIKQKLGRPSSYRPEYAQQMVDYFDQPAWDVTNPDGSVTEGFFPTLAGFCCEINVTKVTLRGWANAKDMDGTPLWPEFLSAFEHCKERQEQVFSQGYMRGKYFNPMIGTLIAKNLMDWRDKQEIESQVTQTVEATISVAGSLVETLDKIKRKVTKE